MQYRLSVRLAAPLVERTSELAAVDALIRSTLAGDGRFVLIEGPAGIGKTSLLDEARRRASAGGAAVIHAQGAVLEREFGFGAVRQLFEPVVERAPSEQRAGLLAGAAGLAEPVVAPTGHVDAPPTHQPAVLHGLYWLTSNLADRSPLLIVVDDVHWCDPPSLQFLVYLVRRLEGLSVGLLAAVRTGDPYADAPLVEELRSESGTALLQPAPLTFDALRELIIEQLGDPHESFVDACRAASGGVPFLVNELLRVLAADGVRPTADAAKQIAETGPSTVAHATMLRLSRLAPSAASVARAVAIMGRQARLDRVAQLADIDPVETRAAVEGLADMQILAGGKELAFAHGLVRQAVYDDLSPTARADAHGRAADILAGERAPADEVATHLLLSAPEGRPDVVATLRTAAREASARGAPGSAVAYLRRAVGEGAAHAQERAVLMHELGSTERFARDPAAAEDLQEAHRLADDPVSRARIGWDLAQVYFAGGLWAEAQEVLDDSLANLGDRDLDIEARLEAFRVASEAADPARAAALDARLPRLRQLVERGGPGTRPLALILAVSAAYRDGDRADARALVEHGLDHGRLFRDEGAESLVQGVVALVGLDDLDAADAAVAGAFEDASLRGSAIGHISACFYRVLIESQRGRLSSAGSFLRSMIESSLEHGVTFAIPQGIWAGTDSLLERSGLDDIAGLVDAVQFEPEFLATVSGAAVMVARGRLRILHGVMKAGGIADLRAAGEVFRGARVENPIAAGWRTPLALALPEDERAEARALVEDELRSAKAFGLARCEGVALRAAGVIEGGQRGIALFEESLRVLEPAGAPLERARTLVELGAALRRANQRVASRGPLRAGLELASVCGAERLAAKAIDELHAAGARPRREMVSGPEALTSAEARVARMAAEGMTNKEIAQALVVTAKTVENQLSVVYRKLGVPSRAELQRALSPDLTD